MCLITMGSWPSKYAADNAARARRRRIVTVNHNIMPVIKTIAPTPPIMPPAIAPLFELPSMGKFDGDDDTDGVVCGVTVDVDWSLLVEDGTTEAVPATSGTSVMEPKIRKLRGLHGKVTYHQQAGQPLNSSYRRAMGETRSDQL